MNPDLETKLKNYSFDEHVHRYAVWTAARAVSRDFTSTATVKSGIESSELRSFVRSNTCTPEVFEKFHRTCANQLITTLAETVGKEKSTYGRAAKIIAIYLKTSIILRNSGEGVLSEIIHPPIDAILLKEISKVTKNKSYQTERWTQLDETRYWNLVNNLRTEFNSFNWRIEFCWSPERELTQKIKITTTNA